jgi:hypothetical protein
MIFPCDYLKVIIFFLRAAQDLQELPAVLVIEQDPLAEIPSACDGM